MKAHTVTIITAATLLLSTALMSSNAAATPCQSVTVFVMGSSAGAVAKFRNRRAERRANKAWESEVARVYGPKYADLDKATSINRRTGGITRGGRSTHVLTASFQFCGK